MTQSRLMWAVFCCAVGLGGSGCSDDSGSTNPTNDGGLPNNDATAPSTVVIIGTSEQLTSLDPGQAFQTATFETLLNVNQPLYLYNPTTLDFEPALAAAEPEVSGAGRVWTIALRKDLKFADGTPFNAAAVKYSVDRTIALDGQPAQSLVTSYIEKVEVVDDYKVKFTLKTAVGFFKALLSSAAYAPVNKSMYPKEKLLNTPFTEAAQQAEWSVEFVDQNTLDPSKLMGLGPYTIEKIEYDEQKNAAAGYYGAYTQITLKANPGFYGGKPAVDTVLVKFYKDGAALAAAINAKDVHVAWNALETSDLKKLAADSANFDIVESAGLVTEFLNLNHRMPPFDNANVRKAVAYGIDRAKIAQQVWELTGKPLYSMVPRGLWSHVESFKDQYGADPNAAKITELLSKEGFSAANPLQFDIWYAPSYPTNKLMSQIIEATLEATKMVEVTLREQAWDDYVGKLVHVDETTQEHDHTYHAFWMGWTPDYGDPDNFVYLFAHSGPDLLGISYFKSTADAGAAMNKLLDDARSETELAIRKAKYTEIQNLWASDVISIPVVQRTKQAVMLKGYALEAPGIDTLLRYNTLQKN